MHFDEEHPMPTKSVAKKSHAKKSTAKAVNPKASKPLKKATAKRATISKSPAKRGSISKPLAKKPAAKKSAAGKITGYTYASHQVSDLSKARKFYEGLLGLKSLGSYDGTWEEYDVGGQIFAVWKASKITPKEFK